MIKKILKNCFVLLLTVATKSYGNEKNNELKICKSVNNAINILGVTIEDVKESITIEDFEDGDTVILFQAKNATHILTKTYNNIDFRYQNDGTYFIEKNNTGPRVYVEKRKGTILLPNTATTSL